MFGPTNDTQIIFCAYTKQQLCVSVICTHMTLEGGEVNVRNEKDRLGLELGHHLEDGHIIAFLQDGNFDIHNCEKKVTTGSILISLFMQKHIFFKYLNLHYYGHLGAAYIKNNNTTYIQYLHAYYNLM